MAALGTNIPSCSIATNINAPFIGSSNQFSRVDHHIRKFNNNKGSNSLRSNCILLDTVTRHTHCTYNLPYAVVVLTCSRIMVFAGNIPHFRSHCGFFRGLSFTLSIWGLSTKLVSAVLC